ncbi:MAG: hypothetical protein JAZ03_17455, partial [Candidatus Thiodiazotropha taylori]|nr:hypothetical protein [Candidatus Thiodiazotropha taylori]MCW4335713.1 hypothetical protein [Candidatus Thiodiazotropha endolucinida]
MTSLPDDDIKTEGSHSTTEEGPATGGGGKMATGLAEVDTEETSGSGSGLAHREETTDVGLGADRVHRIDGAISDMEATSDLT